MVRLHAGDHVELRKARDVGGREMLRVFDPEAAVAAAVLVDDAIVNVEQQTVRAIADRVDHDVEPGLVGVRNPGVEILGRVDEEPAVLRRVVERLMERGGMRTERTVDEALQAADAEPFVSAPIVAAVLFPRDDFAQAAPVGQRNDAVDAGAERVRLARAGERRQVAPRPHVVHRRHALLGHVLHRRGKRAVAHPVGRRGDRTVDERHGVVLQQAGRVAVRAADDLAAGDVLRLARDAGRLQRRAVGERHVAVQPIDPDRMVRGRGIDPVAARQLAPPETVVPVAAGDPRAGRDRRGEGLDARDELVARVRVAQLHGREPESAVDEMDVRVDESRYDEAAVRVERRDASREPADLVARTDGGDALAGDRYGLAPGTRRLTRPHARVHDRRGYRCGRVHRRRSFRSTGAGRSEEKDKEYGKW